jgi:hypothetical protein
LIDEVRYERNPDYIFRKIVDELVLVPMRQDVADMDCIYTLNGLGAFVWDRLDGRMSLAEIHAAILNEYASDAETVAADLQDFVQELESAGAVRRV